MRESAEIGEGQVKPTTVYLTKSDVARRHIQEMIISGAVRAGERITTREVSETLGMSETPIREAMKSLSAEGWLDFHAHLGVVVASFNVEQVFEIYALRGMLGALAIELGGATYSDKRFEMLDENIGLAEVAVRDGDAKAYASLNHQFHLLLSDTPNAQWTLKLLSSLRAQTSAMHRGFQIVPQRMRGSLDEHIAILKAIKAKDFAGAGALVREHERIAGEALATALESGKSLSV